jgi:hypothetical protein
MTTPGPTPIDMLRLYIDDVEPLDGQTEPMFSAAELQAALDQAAGDPERAAIEGWRWKAAKFAKLVDVTEGNASRAMSDMQSHALSMVRHFEQSRAGATEGRTRIGSIRRRSF